MNQKVVGHSTNKIFSISLLLGLLFSNLSGIAVGHAQTQDSRENSEIKSNVSTHILEDTQKSIQLPSLAGTCDVQVYYGVQHCTDGTGIHYIVVNLNDPHVR